VLESFFLLFVFDCFKLHSLLELIHGVFEDLNGFLVDFVENINENIHIFMCVLRHKIQTKTSFILSDNWIFDSIYMYTIVHHKTRYQTANDFISNVDNHNWARLAEDLIAESVEFSFGVIVIIKHFWSNLITVFTLENAELCQSSVALNRINSICEHVCCAVQFEVFNDMFILTSDESKVCGKTLGTTCHQKHIR